MASDARSYRLANIDLVRGLVIVIMALDHVRDYVMAGAQQDPTADPDVAAALFFTRWITHFCAPVFVFLAGTSAGLMAVRKTPSELGRFLLTRGLWLILIEWFVISTGFTFAPFGIAELGGQVLVTFQVIWALGASMVVLAAAQFLGARACALIGGAIVLGHNILDPVWPVGNVLSPDARLWVALHSQAAYVVGPFYVAVAYPLLPWIGVMLLGFGAAWMFQDAPAERDRRLVWWGTFATLAFVALRLSSAYGEPNPWEAGGGVVRTLIDVLNTTKYPPSLQFLLMTLGPAALLCAYADRVPAWLRERLIVFGRVPFAFYVVHFYLIHAIAVVLGTAQGFAPAQLLTIMFFFPPGYGLPLSGVYAVWALVVVVLYPFCAWVASVKARRRDWWLSYV